MKLLIDQNLSHRLVYSLKRDFEGTAHVRDFDMQSATDEEIWDFARQGGYVIISKDEDFHQRSFLIGQPPKVVWVRLGNCTTEHVLENIRRHTRHMGEFDSDEEAAFLVLTDTR